MLEQHVNRCHPWCPSGSFIAGSFMTGHVTERRRGVVKVRRKATTAVRSRRAGGFDPTKWIRSERLHALRALSARATTLTWSPRLLRMLIKELFVEEDFVRVCGNPQKLPFRRYPQGVLVALALRHSWREDLLKRFTQRMRVHESRSRPSRGSR